MLSHSNERENNSENIFRQNFSGFYLPEISQTTVINMHEEQVQEKDADFFWVDVYIDRTHTTHFSTWILDCKPPKTFLNPNSQWKIFFSIFLTSFKNKKKGHFFYFCIKQEFMNSTLYLQYPRQHLQYLYSQLGLSFLNFLTKSSELQGSSSMRRQVSLSSSFRI